MATSRQDIKQWIEEGKRNGATYVIITCDTFDHEDFPVFVKPEEDVREVTKVQNSFSMQRVMEVYSCKVDTEWQLNQFRCFNYNHECEKPQDLDTYLKQYTYQVCWSEPDQEYVASCLEFPSLSYLEKMQLIALAGISRLVREVCINLQNESKRLPEPKAAK